MAKYKDAAEIGKTHAEAERRYESMLRGLAEQNRQWRNRYGEIIDIMIDDLAAEEKQKLYGIHTPYEIADMGRQEQELLLAILWLLSTRYTKPKDEGSQFLQQNFLRSVQMHLGILEIQCEEDTLLQKLGAIDSKRDEMAIMQVVAEYLFLENNDHQYTTRHSHILSCFEYAGRNVDVMQEIQERIDKYLMATGVLGLAMKYSYKIADHQDEEIELATYRIEIRYGKEDAKAIKLLRASLENRQNICYPQEIIKGKHPQSSEYDFIIDFGDNEASQQALSFGKQNTLFDVYGCTIVSPEGSNTYVLKYNPEFEGYSRDEFIAFYKQTCLANDGVRYSVAKTMAEKQEKKKPRKWRLWEKISDLPQKMMNKLDEIDDNKIGGVLLKLASLVPVFVVGMVSFAMSFVVAIPEELAQERIEKLQESNFDKAFIAEAQKDILTVKMSEIILHEQQRNAKPKA